MSRRSLPISVLASLTPLPSATYSRLRRHKPSSKRSDLRESCVGCSALVRELHRGRPKLSACQRTCRGKGSRSDSSLSPTTSASAPKEQMVKRRGIAGDIVVFKVAGAAAEKGMTLDDIERVAQKG